MDGVVLRYLIETVRISNDEKKNVKGLFQTLIIVLYRSILLTNTQVAP